MYIVGKNADNLDALLSATGVPAPAKAGAGCTLGNGTVYLFVLGGDFSPAGEAVLDSFQLKWGTTYVGSFLVESCNFARKLGRPDPVGVDDITDYDIATKGAWMQENPATGAYISLASSDGTTGGATLTGATVTVAGGAAGGAMIHIGNLGARRVRLRVNVTTGDVIRCGAMAKGRGYAA